MRERHTVRGECVQLLGPDTVDDYAVGIFPELFADYGWSVAVVVEDSGDRESDTRLLDALRRFVPWRKQSYVSHVIVWNPDFREGDTVRLACDLLTESPEWFIHPENPLLAEIEGLTPPTRMRGCSER